MRSLILTLAVVLASCTLETRQNNQTEYLEGKRLSEIYCVSCHLHTTPEVLDRISWEKVLMTMKDEMEFSGVLLSDSDWLKIQQYYLLNAPNQLLPPAEKKPITIQAGFKPFASQIFQSEHIPAITAVNWDTVNQKLYLGDLNGQLHILEEMKPPTTYQLQNIPIQAHFNPTNKNIEVLGMGSFMPSDDLTGQLITIGDNGSMEVLIDSLPRPVHFISADLDGDDRQQFIISSFGSTEGEENTGKLSLFSLEQHHYTEKVIKESPGAIKSAVTDANKDGLMDIIALFAQGKEALYLFTYQGNHDFEERLIQEFNPVYGSNDFELVDINQDSFPDIVMTNGDNGDNSPVFKDYHGVRILLNNGDYQFNERYFYPLNGASRVICEDFDADNDIDFVVLSMYPDLIRWKNEVLIYFENHGDLSFVPQFIEEEPAGRWILMDTGDIDSDGFPDIIVGSNLVIRSILTPPRIQEQWTKAQKTVQVFTSP